MTEQADYGKEHRFQGDGFVVHAFVSPHNSRIRVLQYDVRDFGAMKQALVDHAMERGLGKIFIKAIAADEQGMLQVGFEKEATIRGYFCGKDASVMSIFTDDARAHTSVDQETFRQLMGISSKTKAVLPEGYTSRIANQTDAVELANLLGATFATYPFPVHDAGFISSSMTSGNVFRVIERNNEVVAMATAEIDQSHKNAELTDFATIPSCQKLGLARYLREQLENDMKREEIPNLYTLARASSIGMNRVFAVGGYQYDGMLKKNCTIGGDFEDMTCWSKQQ